MRDKTKRDQPPGHFCELLAVAVLDDVGDVVVEAAGRERVANRKKRIHPVGSLVDLR